MKNQSGIYKIQSKIKPERIYIGSAKDITHRWLLHFNDLSKNKHHSAKLQNHVNKYGIDDLSFSIIELCFIEWLVVREQWYLNKFKPYFNICKTAGNTLGRKCSDETKNKISKANSNPSEETRSKMREFAKNRKISEDTRKKMAEKAKGNNRGVNRIFTKEYREKLSRAAKGRIPWNKGEKNVFSKEALAKISKSAKERVEKYGMPNCTGYKHTEEAKEKMRKPRNAEVKERCRIAAFKTWELRRLKNKINNQEVVLCN